jgi:hypothetical protein
VKAKNKINSLIISERRRAKVEEAKIRRKKKNYSTDVINI